MRCPVCADDDDRVVDSRTAVDGSAIRRRRECAGCGHRFTTFERLEALPVVVVKRSGERVPFDRARIEAGVASAAKGRPISDDQLVDLARAVEEEVCLDGPEVGTDRIGLAVLERLRHLDEVAYLRFASVYKGFDAAADFEAEVRALTKEAEVRALTKETAPKQRGA